MSEEGVGTPEDQIFKIIGWNHRGRVGLKTQGIVTDFLERILEGQSEYRDALRLTKTFGPGFRKTRVEAARPDSHLASAASLPRHTGSSP